MASPTVDYVPPRRSERPILPVLFSFTRPHTLYGSLVAIPCILIYSLLPLKPPGLPPVGAIPALLAALLPSLAANAYITGLNQLTDLDIDLVNKPFLPLPSGKLKYSTARLFVLFMLLASMAPALYSPSFSSPFLVPTIVVSVILGTIYSLPPFRLKRFPTLAMLCISFTR